MRQVLHSLTGLNARSLEAALDQGLLTPVFQPVVRLSTGQVVAVEALARLVDPEDGRLRTPAEFIEVAEESGLVRRIDRLMLELSAPVVVHARELLAGEPFSLGVNLSVASLTEDLPAAVADICRRAGLPANALVLELTETSLSLPGNGHGAILHALHDWGCNVTMDDFGTGFSSLSHLARFPVDGLKIDRSFTALIGTTGRGSDVAAALVGLGKALGAHVVAEGIETRTQLAALRAAGCPFGQGYLFARPLTAATLFEQLERGHHLMPLPRPRLA